MSRRSLLNALGDVVLGAAVFWGPRVFLRMWEGRHRPPFDSLVLTSLLPFMAVLGLVVNCIVRQEVTRAFATAWYMALGIWLFGPLMMSIGLAYTGDGVAREGGWKVVAIGTPLFPIFTWMMSAYDGTTLGILLATLCLPAAGFLIQESQGKIKW